MIHLARWLSREGIVGSDLAIVGADRGGHLALGLAPNHITGCPDMRDTRPQVLIDAHCSSCIESDSHPLEPNVLGVRASRCRHQELFCGEGPTAAMALYDQCHPIS